jgi:hypothetical protein
VWGAVFDAQTAWLNNDFDCVSRRGARSVFYPIMT